MLCLNRGYEGKSSNSLYAGGHVATSLIGSTLNWLYLRLSLDNSISGSQSNISAHYDLSNDLFATFLDKEFMVYSSAIYDASLDTCGELQFSGSLESAEIRKIDTLIDRLNLSKEHHLLDVGFGWGGISIRAAERFGCRVTGITLSIAQKEEAERRVRDKKLSHLITFHLVDYRVFADENRKKFDRIISCEMIEAIGHNYLGTYFESIDKLLRPDGIFVMEAITTPEIRYQEYLKSTDFISSVIFPGSCCPSLAALLNAMAKSSSLSLEGFDNINLHYAQTLRDWRYRYRVNELSLSLSLYSCVLCRERLMLGGLLVIGLMKILSMSMNWASVPLLLGMLGSLLLDQHYDTIHAAAHFIVHCKASILSRYNNFLIIFPPIFLSCLLSSMMTTTGAGTTILPTVKQGSRINLSVVLF